MTEAAILFALFYISVGWVVAICFPNGYENFRNLSLFILWPIVVAAVIFRQVRRKK